MIKANLENALKDAMRANDHDAKRTIRMALANIKLAEVENGNAIDDVKAANLLQKEIKTRLETIEEAQKGGRLDLIEENERDIVILKRFLPEEMNDTDLIQITKDVITLVQAKSITDMGKVMKELIPRVAGKASSDKVSKIVKQVLNSEK